MPTPREELADLKEKVGKMVHDARQLDDRAKAEKRSLDPTEKSQFDAIMTAVEDHESRIATLEAAVSQSDEESAAIETDTEPTEEETRSRGLSRIEALERRLLSISVERRSRPIDPQRRGRDSRTPLRPNARPEYRSLFGHYCQYGPNALALHPEYRAMSADVLTEGGYLLAPQQMVQELIKFVDDMVVVRGLARKFTVTTSQSLGAPSLDTDMGSPTWTSEIVTGSEDSSMAFGGRELSPHPLARRIKVSRKLLRSSVLSAEEIIREALGRQFGYAQENAYMIGSGANQPLGLFTPSAFGINTDRDVSTNNTATQVSPDNLIHVKYTLKGQYHARANWLFHRTVVREIRKLKDGNGQYLWQAGIGADRPNTILDLPYQMSEYVPSTLTASQYVGILGDFNFYWIVDSLDLEIQRLMELYAEANQIGFIGRYEGDGMPVLGEAFVRVQMGA